MEPRVVKPPYKRYRTRTTPVPLTSSFAWWQVNRATGNITYNVPWTNVGDGGGQATVEYMSDVVTPAYDRERSKGGIVNSPMNKRTTVTSGSDAGWGFTATYSETIYVGQASENYFARDATYYPLPVLPAGLGESYDNLLTEMVTQLRAKVNASTAQLAVSLGEMRETMRLLARPTQGLGRLIEAAGRFRTGRSSRGQSRNMSDMYQGLESLWLTGRYGWRPLMIDIEKFLEACGESRWKLRDRVAVKRELPLIEGPTLPAKLDLGGGFSFSATTKSTLERTLVMGNFHELADPDRSVADLLGTRLQDMPLAAWNLIPFSFVVDWFINVSQLLGTLSSFNTHTLAEWFITEDRVKTVLVSGAGTAPAGWVIARYPNCTLVRTDVVRTRQPYLPKNPGLAFREDSARRFFQGDLRNLDALALLTTTFRTGRLPALRGVR